MFIVSLFGFYAGYVEIAASNDTKQLEESRKNHKQAGTIALIASSVSLLISIGLFVYLKMKSGKSKQQTKQ
jgi:hypothetical protein